MYRAMRQLKVKPDELDEAIQRSANGFVPILRRMPGFAEYIGSLVGHYRGSKAIYHS